MFESMNVTLADAATMIGANGHKITYVLRGRPGIGKSSTLKVLASMFPDYHARYIDCPTLVDGDMGIYVPDRDTWTMRRVAPSEFFPDDGKPVIIMLDEFLKCDRRLKKQFLQLLLDRVTSGRKLTEGSIVFATSNLASDNIADTIDAHEGNRITELVTDGPTVKQWLAWAGNNGVSARMGSFVSFVPEVLGSYTDEGSEDNPYIQQPRKAPNVYTFCSHRSITLADEHVKANFPDRLLRSALAGCIGRAATERFMSFLLMEKDMVMATDIFANPQTAKLPDSAGAILMSYFHAIPQIETQGNLAALMAWSNRTNRRDLQGVLMTTIMNNDRLKPMATRNAEACAWATANHELMI